MAILTNIVSAWKFNESSGNAADSAGSNTLTNNNTCTYSAGQLSNAVNTASASSQYLDITDAAQTGLDILGDLSIAFWAKWTDFTGQDFIIGKDSIAATLRSYIVSSTSTVMLLDLSSDGSTSTEKNDSHSISTGVWTHIVCTYNAAGGTAYFFINGVRGTQMTGFPTSIANTAAPFSISTFGLGLGNFFNGSIDMAAIWSRELVQADVDILYNGGVGREYPFSTGSGAVRPISNLPLLGV